MKILKIRCLVFNLLRLVIPLLQLTLFQKLFLQNSHLAQWFLYGHVAPLAPLYEGPYKVLARSLKTIQIQVGKRVEMVSVQRLKPAFTADDEAPVEPPRRGRPPRQPPPVPPDPPRRRGRPRKAVAEATAVAPPKRKRVTFNLKPKILHQRLQC